MTTLLQVADAARREQVTVNTEMLKALILAMNPLDGGNLSDLAVHAYILGALSAIAEGRAASHLLAQQQYARMRGASGLDAVSYADRSDLDAPGIVDRSVGSLLVNGPGVMRRALARGDTPQQAYSLAKGTVGRAGKQLMLDAGRDTIIGATVRDPKAAGWARLASRKTCSFCLMLISRGPVYSERSVKFRSHSGCGCSAAPVFDRSEGWTPQAREAKDLWSDAGGDPTAFRRLVEGREAPAPSAA